MTPAQQHRIDYYIDCLDKFVSGKIAPANFVSEYIASFKAEQVELPEPAFTALDRLFGDADVYCEDPSLRGDDDIGDRELRSDAARVLEELRRMR
jgi:hypothetical protein